MIWGSLCPRPANAWRWGRWRLRLHLRYATGWDDNVRRLAIPPQPEIPILWGRLADSGPVQSRLPPAAIQHDGVHQLSGQLRTRYRSPHHIWSARYALGGKLFYLTPDADSLVQSASTSYYGRPHRRILLGASANAKDRRRVNTGREFSYLNGQLHFLWFAPLGFRLALSGGYNLYNYRNFESFTPDAAVETFTDGQRFTFHGDLYSLQLTKTFGRVFRIFAGYQFARRMYQVKRRRFPRPTDQQTGEPSPLLPSNCSLDPQNSDNFLACSVQEDRGDLSHSFSLGFRLLYKVLLRGSYTLQVLNADSYTESYLGHDIRLSFAATPFWEIDILVQLRIQLRNYFNGVPFDPNRPQNSEDDNLTALTIRLSRPLWRNLNLDLRYSHYANLFGLGINQYSRNLLTLGFSLIF